MKVLYLHGWTSKPGGVKPSYLIENGCTVFQPALPDEDFAGAVRIAEEAFRQRPPDVVVGSSRGGAVALNMDSGDTPLVLLCPAWKRWGTATTAKSRTVILHSPTDETISYQDSVDLVVGSGLPPSALIEAGHEHRLADAQSLRTLLDAVRRAAQLHLKTPSEEATS